MKHAIDKYIPYLKTTFTVLLILTVLIVGAFAATSLSDTKRGAAFVKLGTLFGCH